MSKRKRLRRAYQNTKTYVLELPQRLSVFRSIVGIAWEQAFVAESLYPFTLRDPDGNEAETHMSEADIREEYGDHVFEQMCEAYENGAERVVLNSGTRATTTGDWGAHDWDTWTAKPNENFDVEN